MQKTKATHNEPYESYYKPVEWAGWQTNEITLDIYKYIYMNEFAAVIVRWKAIQI